MYDLQVGRKEGDIVQECNKIPRIPGSDYIYDYCKKRVKSATAVKVPMACSEKHSNFSSV